ncbi:MAG: alcohol dehydrogenase catalytic domain-containing protein, partial [Phycisphaerae bacterium]|nr:alcohol dehydrogenase catalytic domain-containing protein [Phycisphaerae bacterium]
MKAALLEQLGSLTVRQVADPELGPYGALCDLLYGATCSGTDIHLIDGHIDWAISAAPTIIGHESIGRVKAIGEKVRNYQVGDLVTRVGAPPASDGSYQSTWGGFASLGVAVDHWAMAEDGLPADQWSGATVNQLLPADFDPRAATMMTTWRETLSYITRMGLA